MMTVRKTRTINLFLGFIFLLLGSVIWPKQETYGQTAEAIHVRLSDDQGRPVENALIQMTFEESESVGPPRRRPMTIYFRHLRDGRYESRGELPSGENFRVRLMADAPGFELENEIWSLAEFKKRTLVIELKKQEEDDPTYTQPATISAAPDGATLSGRVQADIEGHWNPSYQEGLVFALSPDKQHVLGFSYTSRYPHSGYFRIDELPMTGDIILVSFMPQVKRLHWMDVVSMDEVVDAGKRHDAWSVGTVWAHLSQPSGGAPHDLSGSGAGALKGAGYALQLMVVAGWISERAMNRRDYSAIDDLTNRLYEYYQDGIEKHIVKAHGLPVSEPETETVDTVADEQPERETVSPPSVGDWPRDTDTEIVEVTSATGRVWMDRNLGASRVATSSTDSQAYGDLYQWGRPADGHQKRNSPTSSTSSSSDQPGHRRFILSSRDANWDWRSPRNDNLWQGVNGVNNPCPPGYRLPTEEEWEEERQSWSSSNDAEAFASPLKLPLAGYRNSAPIFLSIQLGGDLSVFFDVDSVGYYWSSSVSGAYARGLYVDSSTARIIKGIRAGGVSVRCTKD